MIYRLEEASKDTEFISTYLTAVEGFNKRSNPALQTGYRCDNWAVVSMCNGSRYIYRKNLLYSEWILSQYRVLRNWGGDREREECFKNLGERNTTVWWKEVNFIWNKVPRQSTENHLPCYSSHGCCSNSTTSMHPRVCKVMPLPLQHLCHPAVPHYLSWTP